MVTVTVSANIGSARSGNILIGNRPLTVNQACGSPTAPSSATTNYNNFCSGAYQNITLTANGGAGSTLRWLSGSCNGTSVGTGSPLTITAPTSTTTYYARWENDCSNSSCASVTVTVNPLPVQPSSITSNYNNFCYGAYPNITLTASGGSGTSIRWSAGSCGGAPIGTTTQITITAPSSTTTYYARWENSCGNSSCASLTVTVYPTPTAPTSLSSDHNNFCQGAYSTIVLTASGGSGTTLRWFSGSCGGTDLGTGNNKSVTAPTTTTNYYARWENSCGNSVCNSTPLTVTVYSPLSAGTISGNQTICYSTDAANITSTSGGGGGSGSYTYSWEYSENGGSTWLNAGSSALTFDPPVLIISTQYRRKVTDPACGSLYTTAVTKTVRTPLDGGYISPDQSICYNADPAVINSVTTPSGASGPPYTYSWEKSLTGSAPWTDAGGSDASFNPSNLTVTTWYHRKATDGNSCTGYSNMRSVTVGLQLSAGSISGDETICYGADAGNITGSSPATGGSGSYSYSWEYSENGGAWTGAGSGGETFDPGHLIIETRFHRNVTDNNCLFSATSGYVTKSVRVATFPGSVSGDQTIFYNTTPTSLNNATPASGGAGSLSYQWQQSVNDGVSWNNITGAVSNSYSPPAITVSTKYHRNTIDNGNSCVFSSNNVDVDITVFASPDNSRNYIYTREPNTAVTDLDDLDSPSDYRSTIEYFDGLGRPDQNIQVLASPSFSDVITPIAYDAFGREPVKYMPFTSEGNVGAYVSNALAQQRNFYDNAAWFQNDTANSKTVFENSPLGTVLEQGAPGRQWQPDCGSDTVSGHTLKYEYTANTNYDVMLWRVQGNSLVNTGGVTYGGYHYYTANTLFKTITKDENWKDLATGDSLLHTTQEFKDLQGNVILKRTFVKNGAGVDKLETYYIYDDFGLLRYVMPPKAVAGISATSYTFSDNMIRGLCYYYRYDPRQRMVLKQLPGADSVFMIYDKRDRLVLSQDGKNRSSNKWFFTKYDRLNRPVLTGILTYGSSVGRESMQTVVNNVYSGGSPRDFFIDRDSTITTTLGFTTGSFPGSSDGTLEYLSASYYDNYIFPGKKNYDASSSISDYSDSDGNTHYFDLTSGLVTGTKTKVLGSASDYITATNYYDSHYRVIQSRKNLYDDANGSEIISSNYDFKGNVLRNRQKQYFGGATKTVDKYYTYDQPGRLLKEESEINGSNRTTIAEMTYNELGQMVKKSLNKSGTTFMQDIDYGYNIRGWLKSINDPDNMGSDIFSMKLLYEDPSSLSNLVKERQFNGNISAVVWNRKTAPSSTLKSAYTFRYDAMSRLINNYYGEGASLTNSDKFREYDYSYDLGGNIQVLKRNNSSGSAIDNLSYSYLGTVSNQLASVSDNTANAAGFNDLNTSGNDYEYDKNGNLTKDLNKGIGIVEYNYLNLPSAITKDGTHSITYYYDATGTKLKQVTVNGGNTTSKYYLDGFEYNSDKSLDVIHMDEGVIHDSSNVFLYDYFIKDHLGNTRLAARPRANNTPFLTQSDDYYPFGLSYSSNTTFDFNNKYLYNGKELQDENLGGVNLDWYSFGARYYDPQIERWLVQDPLAEYRLSLTPYNYCKNNPMVFINLFGLIDTIKLPEVKIVATKTPSKQSGFINFLYGIDRALQGNDNSSKTRNADWFENWCIRHIDMRSLVEISEAAAEAKGGYGADPTLRNYVRTNESYQGIITEDEEIQGKAGNNKDLIEKKTEWAKKDDVNSNENHDTTITIRTEKQGVFNKYRWLDYKDTVIKVSDVQKVEKLSNERVNKFKNGD